MLESVLAKHLAAAIWYCCSIEYIQAFRNGDEGAAQVVQGQGDAGQVDDPFDHHPGPDQIRWPRVDSLGNANGQDWAS